MKVTHLFSGAKQFPSEVAKQVSRGELWKASAFGKKCNLSLKPEEFSALLDRGHSLLLANENEFALTLRGQLKQKDLSVNLDLFDLPGKNFVGLFDFILPVRGPAVAGGQLFLPEAAFSPETVERLESAGATDLAAEKIAQSRAQWTSTGLWLREGNRQKNEGGPKNLSQLLVSTGLRLAWGLGVARFELLWQDTEASTSDRGKLKSYFERNFAAELLYPDRGMVIRT